MPVTENKIGDATGNATDLESSPTTLINGCGIELDRHDPRVRGPAVGGGFIFAGPGPLLAAV